MTGVGGAEDRCEVAIVGLGPVGAALATLLGERGVDVIAVEPEREPFPYPRAIAADDEMLRTLLRIPGLADPWRLFETDQRIEVRGPSGTLLTAIAFKDSTAFPDFRSSISRRWNGRCALLSTGRRQSGSVSGGR